MYFHVYLIYRFTRTFTDHSSVITRCWGFELQNGKSSLKSPQTLAAQDFAPASFLSTPDKKSSEICGFRNFFCAFCGTLESEEKVVHNACITAVKKVRKLGFEKVTFCNFFGERFCTHAEFLWPVAPWQR